MYVVFFQLFIFPFVIGICLIITSFIGSGNVKKHEGMTSSAELEIIRVEEGTYTKRSKDDGLGKTYQIHRPILGFPGDVEPRREMRFIDSHDGSVGDRVRVRYDPSNLERGCMTEEMAASLQKRDAFMFKLRIAGIVLAIVGAVFFVVFRASLP